MQKYVGALELFGTRQEAIQNIRQRLPIKYRVRFPVTAPLPVLTEIRHNNKIICSGLPGKRILIAVNVSLFLKKKLTSTETGPYVTTIRLEHTLYTELAASQQYPAVQPLIPEVDGAQDQNMYGGNAGIDYNYQPMFPTQQQPQHSNTYQEPKPFQPQNQYEPPNQYERPNQYQQPNTYQQPTMNKPQSQQDPFANPIQQQTTEKPRPFQQQETQDEEGTVFRPRPPFAGGLRPKEPFFTQQVQNEITPPIKPHSAKRYTLQQ